jgi:hypothetical protein
MSRPACFIWVPLVLSAACSASQSSQPIAPTIPTTTPTTTATNRSGPAVPSGNRTISGVVTERLSSGALQPLPGANVNAWIDLGNFGYSYMWGNGPRTTDSAGRYVLTNVPDGARVLVDTYKSEYVQQCAAPPIQIFADASIDLELIARNNIIVTPQSIASKPGFRTITGVIYENTEDGRRPVAGAFVDYEPVMDSPAATTYSDASGRYLLCGLPDDRTVDIGAGNGSRVAYTTAAPGQTSGVDLTFK